MDLDLKVTRRSLNAYLIVDACNFQISVGFGEWFLNISLFTYSWGRQEVHMLGNAIEIT